MHREAAAAALVQLRLHRVQARQRQRWERRAQPRRQPWPERAHEALDRRAAGQHLAAAVHRPALEEQVLPRAGKAETDAFSQACQAGLADTLPNKSTIVLRLKPGGTVDLLAGGAVVASVDAPKVADALLDVYVGPNAVSPAARDSICAGLKAF